MLIATLVNFNCGNHKTIVKSPLNCELEIKQSLLEAIALVEPSKYESLAYGKLGFFLSFEQLADSSITYLYVSRKGGNPRDQDTLFNVSDYLNKKSRLPICPELNQSMPSIKSQAKISIYYPPNLSQK